MFCVSSTGVVGGSHYNSEGGGSNHLCLRSDPVYLENDTAREHRAEVYGSEYEYPPNPEMHDHDVPCAVCLVIRQVVLMMPGTNLCDEGWSTEYVGQISTERTHHTHQRSEFICVDNEAEPTPLSSLDNDDGILLNPAQTICGSLPCPPFVEDKDLLCVVCSR